MELLDYLRAIRNHWVGVALIVVFTVSAAGLYTLTQPKVYAADAGGFVTAGQAADSGLAQLNDSLAKSRAASYVDIAKSRAVADLAIEELGLSTTASALIGNIEVDQPLNTVLIKIKARSSSPIEAQRLADAWVRALSQRVAELEDPTDSGTLGVLGIEPTEAAALPSTPVSPLPARNLALGLVLGLLLAIGYATLRSLLDRRLRSPEEAERRFGVPIVGRLPATGLPHEDGLFVTDAIDQQSFGIGESFRRLRSNLTYMNVDNPPRVIVVTSARPQDGKSTVAANLAAAVSLSGQPVTLVDGDLRRPTVADKLGLVEGAGLTDVLIGQVELDDVLQEHASFENLHVLAAGSTPPNPSEMLGSHAMQALLKELSGRGIVIVDAPPLLPVTDAAVLTRSADGAIVVVSHGKTLDTELDECLRQLTAVQGHVLGVVFNRMPRRGAGYYAAGSYYGAADEGKKGIKARLSRRGGADSAPSGGKRAAR
ncbi:polysaccharide biosynthesis tyrosine autokinase [Nocardioides sp.]|uniref:polysaccharide biosynthesis tyrosine autokinase n=1 Tax=Nocardioides sp. TaxID=35761 RepID=UPI002B26C057|nr:polysaccharide biosynthesis tyrosine autokinase [Nocardioides sp.]